MLCADVVGFYRFVLLIAEGYKAPSAEGGAGLARGSLIFYYLDLFCYALLFFCERHISLSNTGVDFKFTALLRGHFYSFFSLSYTWK